jgi:DNA replication protein DnaC
MLTNPTAEKLKSMKLKVMAEMTASPDPTLNQLSFDERFGIMVEKEYLAKQNARIQRLLYSAGLSSDTSLEDINYSSGRTIDKNTVAALSACLFIDQRLNVLITGKTGSGKTYLAKALGVNACRHGYSVKYLRIPELLLEIAAARSENRYSRFMNNLTYTKLLILDDIGLKSYTQEESRDILEIAESRYNKASTILSSQVAHDKWYELFPDPTIADAIMDRIIHNSYILALDSKKSMREVMAERSMKAMV